MTTKLRRFTTCYKGGGQFGETIASATVNGALALAQHRGDCYLIERIYAPDGTDCGDEVNENGFVLGRWVPGWETRAGGVQKVLLWVKPDPTGLDSTRGLKTRTGRVGKIKDERDELRLAINAIQHVARYPTEGALAEHLAARLVTIAELAEGRRVPDTVGNLATMLDRIVCFIETGDTSRGRYVLDDAKRLLAEVRP